MSVISDPEEIKQIISPDTFDENFLERGWQYRLRLGEEVYRTSDDLPRKLKRGDAVSLRSGEFALLLTEEKVKLKGNQMGFISLRFTYKARGLINISGFHIDPSYEGKIIFAVFNAGPNDIVVKRGDDLFMAFFLTLNNEAKGTRLSGYNDIRPNLISNIRGTSTTLRKSADRIERLESLTRTLTWVIGILATFMGGLIFKILLGSP